MVYSPNSQRRAMRLVLVAITISFCVYLVILVLGLIARRWRPYGTRTQRPHARLLCLVSALRRCQNCSPSAHFWAETRLEPGRSPTGTGRIDHRDRFLSLGFRLSVQAARDSRREEVAGSDPASRCGPVRFSDRSLEQLAGRIARELVHEVDRGGLLVAGAAVRAERDPLFVRGFRSRPQLDHRFHGFAPRLIRHTDHR